MDTIITFIKNNGSKGNPIFYLIFLFFSLLFIVLLIPYHPYPGSYIIKSIPVLSLSIVAFKNIKGLQGMFLFAGLLFSAAGDITLDLDREKYFIAGLALFLLAHIFYIVSMLNDYKFEKIKIIPAIFLLFYSSMVAYFLRNIPQGMLIPVMLYLFIISLMTMSALFMRCNRKIIFTGAAIFMISDTIIAVNKFIYPIPYSMFFNISTYYLAQFLIVTGFLYEKK